MKVIPFIGFTISRRTKLSRATEAKKPSHASRCNFLLQITWSADSRPNMHVKHVMYICVYSLYYLLGTMFFVNLLCCVFGSTYYDMLQQVLISRNSIMWNIFLASLLYIWTDVFVLLLLRIYSNFGLLIKIHNNKIKKKSWKLLFRNVTKRFVAKHA